MINTHVHGLESKDIIMQHRNVRVSDIDFRRCNERQPLEAKSFESIEQNFHLLVHRAKQMSTSGHKAVKLTVRLIANSAKICRYSEKTSNAGVQFHAYVLDGWAPLQRFVAKGQFYVDFG